MYYLGSKDSIVCGITSRQLKATSHAPWSCYYDLLDMKVHFQIQVSKGGQGGLLHLKKNSDPPELKMTFLNPLRNEFWPPLRFWATVLPA